MRENTKRRDDRIRELRRQGMSRKDIVEETMYSASVVARALRDLDECQGRQRFKDHKDEIIQMYKKGIAVKKIAERTGVSESTINRRMRGMGIGRGRGWKRGTSVPHEKQIHRETCGSDADPEVFAQAEHRQMKHRKVKHITVRGKNYLDVSDWYM